VIRHHFTLEHLAHVLDERLRDATLVEAYTQEKDTCVLIFIKGAETMHVLISVEHAYGTVSITGNANRARKNTIDVFRSRLGQKCTAVKKVIDDRIISFWMADCMINVYLFSGGSGNVVVTQNGVIVDALSDKATVVGTTIEPSEHVAQLGKWYQAELQHNPDVEAQCKATREYFVLKRPNDVLFSLIPITGWDIENRTTDIFEAIRWVISSRRNRQLLAASKKQLLAQRSQDKIRLQRSINGIEKEDIAAGRIATYRGFGDMLLTYSEPNATGLTHVEIEGFADHAISVPLDKEKTVVENANNYYQKAKKSEKALQISKAKLPSLQKQLERVTEEIQFIEENNNLKELEKLMQKTEQKNLSPATKFREFPLEGGFVVYVGRNASNNDELTMRYAKANDLWFHARGVSGSHTILRCPEGMEKPPKKILEAAASIAAYYSGARNAKYVPVAYTQKKHVRKFKGANVGAVTLERETVVMVPPMLPETEGTPGNT